MPPAEHFLRRKILEMEILFKERFVSLLSSIQRKPYTGLVTVLPRESTKGLWAGRMLVILLESPDDLLVDKD